MLITRYTTLLALIALLSTASCDSPSSQNKAAKATQSADTHKLNPAFWDYAISSNMLQIELGKLASEKGTTQQVKDLGSQAVRFHSKALEQLKKLGSGHNAIQLPDSLGSADRTMVNDFALLEGTDFDVRYRDHVLISHKTQVDRYGDALQKADSPKLKKWLTDMQEHMRKQLQEVEQPDSSLAVMENR